MNGNVIVVQYSCLAQLSGEPYTLFDNGVDSFVVVDLLNQTMKW
jgi:hypothetical protein